MCNGLKLSVRSVQRWKKHGLQDIRKGPKVNARALSSKEKQEVLEVLNSIEFCDFTPNEIVAKLADQGRYLTSVSTIYRILRSLNLLQHRKRSKTPERLPRIETVATAPNQVWCWDITYLRTTRARVFYKLYVFQDLFSRKIVTWHVDEVEDELIALNTLMRGLEQEQISGAQLRLHSDNGNAMKGLSIYIQSRNIGIVTSFSRPSVSDDNPFIESFFKTMKYSPQFPYRAFLSLEEAKKWVESFMTWYNEYHLHSAINYISPNQKHRGQDKDLLEKRHQVFKQAQQKNPVRWSKSAAAWSYSNSTSLPKHSCRVIHVAK